MEYYVFVTNSCNLDCQYCSGISINKNEQTCDQPEYTFETLRTFILNTQKKFDSETIDIVFYGGEPTLNYHYLTEFVSFFGSSLDNYKINYILHTNGILLNRIPLNILKQLKLILVSINYEKIPKDGLDQTYFSKIIDNVKYIRELHPINILGRLTITENVSLYTNVLQVSNFFDYVHWQIINCFQFKDFNRYFRNYRYELSLLFDYWYSFFKKGYILNYVPFLSALNLLYDNEMRDNFLCGFNSFSVYIQNNGKCYLCPEEMNNPKYQIGDLKQGIKFKAFDLKIGKCKNCEFLFNCWGRCGRMHLEFDDKHIEEYCQLNKEMFKLFIEHKEDILSLEQQIPFREKLQDINFIHTESIP